jgi:hypothetical protein
MHKFVLSWHSLVYKSHKLACLALVTAFNSLQCDICGYVCQVDVLVAGCCWRTLYSS